MSLTHTLEKLVTFPTITGNIEAANACLSYIKEELHAVPLHWHRHVHNGYPALVATTKRTKNPKLWLAAHVDVVPGGHHLFKPRMASGKLFGRGVFDMKFAVACYLELLKGIGKSASSYDLGLMLTSDEETGGFHGVKLLFEKANYKGDLAFLPDGGGPWQFEECAKGKMVVKVYTEGVAGHASRPWHGRNAIDELSEVLSALNLWVKDNLRGDENGHWHSTAVVTKIQGGEGENMVPAYAEATLDVRPVRSSHAIALEKRFALLEKRFPNTRFDVCCNEPAYGVSKGNGSAKLFAKLAHAQYGITCGWTRSHGSSDGRFFTAQGIPTLLILPHAGGAHSEEEWIDLADLERFHAVLRGFVDEVARL